MLFHTRVGAGLVSFHIRSGARLVSFNTHGGAMLVSFPTRGDARLVYFHIRGSARLVLFYTRGGVRQVPLHFRCVRQVLFHILSARLASFPTLFAGAAVAAKPSLFAANGAPIWLSLYIITVLSVTIMPHFTHRFNNN